MKHYILTRSAFGRTVSLEENRRRLALLAGVTVPSLRAQTNRDFTWIVLIAPDDPCLADRKAAIAAAGLPTILRSAGRMVLRPGPDRPQSPEWRRNIDWRAAPILTTRLDDDDAFVPEAMEWVRAEAERLEPKRRTVLTFPSGWRLAGPLVEQVTYTVPMFSTLVAPYGQPVTINDASHLSAARLASDGRLHPASIEPAWLWVRHDMTRSHQNMRRGVNSAGVPLQPVSAEVRARFPIDWELVQSLPQRGPTEPDPS